MNGTTLLIRRRQGVAMSITDVCLKKPVFAWMIMAATITFGIVPVTRIGISRLLLMS